jgi:2-polyprenyl-3-methyl-5-hydroxy-6-metoxy-1,4-benzoquinol methylase
MISNSLGIRRSHGGMYESEEKLIPHYDSHVKYYTPVREDTIEKIFRILDFKPEPPMNILDLGCGTGWFAFYMKMLHPDYEVTAVDVSQVRIDRARTEHPGPQYVCHDIYRFLRFMEYCRYNLICLWDVLEHLENPIELLWLARSRLLPTGVILASVPHDHEYVAHLKVFKNSTDVMRELGPDTIHEWEDSRKYYLCRWEKQDVSSQS